MKRSNKDGKTIITSFSGEDIQVCIRKNNKLITIPYIQGIAWEYNHIKRGFSGTIITLDTRPLEKLCDLYHSRPLLIRAANEYGGKHVLFSEKTIFISGARRAFGVDDLFINTYLDFNT